MQMPDSKRRLTVREYAKQERISIQAAYRRIWEQRVKAERFLDRWLILPSQTQAEREATATR